MKPIIIILFLFVLKNTTVGQSFEPLIDTTKQWNILQYEYGNFYDLFYINTIGERFRGDTLISGMKYSYLETCKNNPDFSTWERSPYLFREDTLNGKVYIHDYEKELLIYDFSLNIGDTLELYEPIIVDSIKTEFIANKNRKVIYFGTEWGVFTIIEGIGTYYDLIEPLRLDVVGSLYINNLLCFSENTTTLLQNGDNCYEYHDYTSVSEYSNNDKILIFPNPLSDKLNIKTEVNLKKADLFIYSNDGRLVLNKKISDNLEEITIDCLQNGLYILKIVEHGKTIHCKEIIVKK